VGASDEWTAAGDRALTDEVFLTPVALDRDAFMRRLIASLGHLNEGLLGSDVAGGYVMQVGLSMGAAIEAEYKRFWGIDRPFTLDEYAHVIVDLKQKIQGNFSVVSKDPTKVVVRTTSCPFDAFVRQSPSLCFMTSSVFGGIAARNFGYAKVVLHRRIALGDDGCYVSVHLQPTAEAKAGVGREYFPDIDLASPDIAEQLRLMDSLRALRRELGETSARWEEVIHSASEAIVVLDREGRIAYANARWRDLLGVEGDELVGITLETIALPDDRQRMRVALSQVHAGERVPGVTLDVLHRDGRRRTAVMSGGPVRDETGAMVGALLIIRDVTAEREAARLKDEFLATASHELQTPIASVKGLAEVLLLTLQRHGSIEPAQLESRLTSIVREADRLALLGRDLLDASRAQAGKLRLDPVPVDLRDLAAATVERRQAVLATAAVSYVLHSRLTPVAAPILADRARLDQVLDNLLENAVKYSPYGGRVDVIVETRAGRALVRFRDEGIGIPAEDQASLFTPFFRARNASAQNLPGLGLGLHLSQLIVEAHGGTITVESVEDQGTTITIDLPLASVDD
jgi:PAS domain S-box-containing protein